MLLYFYYTAKCIWEENGYFISIELLQREYILLYANKLLFTTHYMDETMWNKMFLENWNSFPSQWRPNFIAMTVTVIAVTVWKYIMIYWEKPEDYQKGLQGAVNRWSRSTGGCRCVPAGPTGKMDGWEVFKLFIKGDRDEMRLDRDETGGTTQGLGMRARVQIKWIYTTAHNMGNKQEELEATVWQANYDLIAITEMWWYQCHNWSAAIGWLQAFQKGQVTKKGWCHVSLY